MTDELSEHFTWQEVIASNKAKALKLDNTLPDNLKAVAKNTALQMELVRTILGNKSIKVTSWYRSPELNTAITRNPNSKSQHVRAEAVDFICPKFGTPYEVCLELVKYKDVLKFDQLIYEGTWIHISFVLPPKVPRLQVRTWKGESKYILGVVK